MSDIIFQPYGKDSFYINLLASDDGDWIFGPCDADKLDAVAKRSIIHSYIKVSGKNPKYHKILINDNFEIKENDGIVVKRDANKTAKINEIYIFVVWNYKNSFLHMEYTTDHADYENIKKNFNVLSTFIIIGDDLKIEKEKIGIGIGTHQDNIKSLIEELKQEKEQEDKL